MIAEQVPGPGGTFFLSRHDQILDTLDQHMTKVMFFYNECYYEPTLQILYDVKCGCVRGQGDWVGGLNGWRRNLLILLAVCSSPAYLATDFN